MFAELRWAFEEAVTEKTFKVLLSSDFWSAKELVILWFHTYSWENTTFQFSGLLYPLQYWSLSSPPSFRSFRCVIFFFFPILFLPYHSNHTSYISCTGTVLKQRIFLQFCLSTVLFKSFLFFSSLAQWSVKSINQYKGGEPIQSSAYKLWI